MGMFDYVRVEYNVPDMPSSTLQGLQWQTKDLENTLGVYTINKDGELMGYGGKYHFTGTMGLMAMTGDFFSGNLKFYDLFIQFEQGDLARISNQPIIDEKVEVQQ